MRLFHTLFGFPERNYSQTRKSLLEIANFTRIPGDIFRERCDFVLTSRDDDAKTKTISISAGTFWMPSVGDLRKLVMEAVAANNDKILARQQKTSTLCNIVGEARSMHTKSTVRSGDIIQAASQFNLLEFPNPNTIPEQGIEQYKFDPTQGPACALACFAGTAYRNYLLPFEDNKRGQTKNRQCNGLDRVEEYLKSQQRLTTPWKVQNGYIEATSDQELETLNQALHENPQLRDELLSRVCIGVQEDTEVTDVLLQHSFHENSKQKFFVTQTYNSAISIGYSKFPKSTWEPMARLVLDATYEATLLMGVLKTIQLEKRPVIFLTKVGGGVFGNDDDWIRESISRAIDKVQKLSGIGLEIRIVHFGSIDPRYHKLELPHTQDSCK